MLKTRKTRDAARPMCLLLSLLVAAQMIPSVGLAAQGGAPAPEAAAPAPAEPEGMPLTLREALAIALDHNLLVAVQRFEPRVNENVVQLAQSVFDPFLLGVVSWEDATTPSQADALQGAAVRNDNTRFARVTFTDPTSIGGRVQVELNSSRFATNSSFFALNPVFNSSLSVSYTQSLRRNFGYDVNTTGIRIAKRDVKVSESRFRQSLIDTVQNVEKAYWDLIFAREDLRVKQHSLELSNETLGQNKIRVDVGTMAPIDVTTAEAEVANRTQNVLLAENAVQNTQDRLVLFLNPPKDSPLWTLPVRPTDEPTVDENVHVDLQAAIDTAFANRPDIEQTRYQIESDQDRVAQARNALRWDLVGDIRYLRAGQSFRGSVFLDPNSPPVKFDEHLTDSMKEIVDENFDTWQLSLSLLIPFGNRQAEANYLNTVLRQQQRRQIIDSQALDATIAVRNSARAVENAAARVKAARVNVRLQKERLAAENKRYENGMTTTFNLLQFQDDLTQAESQVIAALVDYNKSLVDLSAAKGTLAEERGVRVADIQARTPQPELPSGMGRR
jgi:outer membrane protein